MGGSSLFVRFELSIKANFNIFSKGPKVAPTQDFSQLQSLVQQLKNDNSDWDQLSQYSKLCLIFEVKSLPQACMESSILEAFAKDGEYPTEADLSNVDVIGEGSC